jgi:hypothetical protein
MDTKPKNQDDLIGKKFRHYKGNEYELVGFGIHTETMEELVIYKALYESGEFPIEQLWIRPKNMFFENVLVNGNKVKRFKRID